MEAEQIETEVEQPREEVSAQEQAKASVEHNWEQVNQVLKLQKQRIEELEARQQAAPKVQEEPDEFADLDPDDYLTVDKARKMAERLAEKKAESKARQVVQEYAQQQSIVMDEQRMRSKHEDYDYVVENFAVPLIKTDPALAYKIQMSKNPAETAYKLGKLSDSYEASTMATTSPKAEKILKNSSRPTSSAAAGNSLRSQAENFSNLTPAQVWEQSQKYARGA